MQRIEAVLNQKGGVGKTTVTLGLASAAAEAEDRVLVVDLDPQASATWVLGVEEPDFTTFDVLAKSRFDTRRAIVASTWSDRVDVLPGSPDLQGREHLSVARLRDALGAVAEDYTAVLIDCPPSLGSLTQSALIAARHALVVAEPSVLGLRGIGGLARLIEQVWDDGNPDLELSGVILNRVPAVSNEAAQRIDELDHIVGSDAVWEPAIPQRVVLTQALGQRKAIHRFGARARSVTDAFDSLWRQAKALPGVTAS